MNDIPDVKVYLKTRSGNVNISKCYFVMGMSHDVKQFAHLIHTSVL